MRRHVLPLALAAAFAAYCVVYLVAWALHLPPETVWRAIFEGIGFGVGAVVLFSVILQLIRR